MIAFDPDFASREEWLFRHVLPTVLICVRDTFDDLAGELPLGAGETTNLVDLARRCREGDRTALPVLVSLSDVFHIGMDVSYAADRINRVLEGHSDDPESALKDAFDELKYCYGICHQHRAERDFLVHLSLIRTIMSPRPSPSLLPPGPLPFMMSPSIVALIKGKPIPLAPTPPP